MDSVFRNDHPVVTKYGFNGFSALRKLPGLLYLRSYNFDLMHMVSDNCVHILNWFDGSQPIKLIRNENNEWEFEAPVKYLNKEAKQKLDAMFSHEYFLLFLFRIHTNCH